METLKYEDFVRYLDRFFKSEDINTLLVRGYFYHDKLTTVLQYINYNKDLTSGIFVVGALSEVPRLFGPSFKSGKFHSVHQGETYKIAGANCEFLKEDINVDMAYGHSTDFCIFYPVESILFDNNKTNRFVQQLKNSNAKKNIIITSNDYSTRAEQLYSEVDETVVLDMSSIHEEEFETIKSNFKREGRELPY
ncbi:hypothetical protein [Ligilactobacillus acidipiscis]|uniref:hypothetical protein n=1 Tax=Ligilactobacillus acidipiscis TaxID=89059 RepID=UPI0022E09871|nr:hypothetical protein [Ligilactobacillus acidipiscis]